MALNSGRRDILSSESHVNSFHHLWLPLVSRRDFFTCTDYTPWVVLLSTIYDLQYLTTREALQIILSLWHPRIRIIRTAVKTMPDPLEILKISSNWLHLITARTSSLGRGQYKQANLNLAQPTMKNDLQVLKWVEFLGSMGTLNSINFIKRQQ